MKEFKDPIREALQVYRKAVNDELKASMLAGARATERRGIFSSAVVVWLMIFQRLNSDHSLLEAVERLRHGAFDDLLQEGSLPARVGRISNATGGYSRARERLGVEVVEKTADGINEALNKTYRTETHQGFHVYVVDGTTIRTTYTESNLREYPQARNQHGKIHFPLLRVGVATNAVTGVVLRPTYGPYNGENAVSELSLVEDLLARIPGKSVVIGDRNFGCCRFADMAQRAGHSVVVRMKEVNAKKFGVTFGTPSGEVTRSWDSVRSREGSCSYEIQGRFIWHTIKRKGFRPIRLVLFTTSDLPRLEIVKLYALRWNVELDIRDIKSTLAMDMLYSKTPTMVAKELILGITAYNLIRHAMVASARTLNVATRNLSFSRVLKRVRATGDVLVEYGISSQAIRASNFVFIDIKSFRLPNRTKKRILEPRKIWRKGDSSFMSQSREAERAILKNTYDSKKLHSQ